MATTPKPPSPSASPDRRRASASPFLRRRSRNLLAVVGGVLLVLGTWLVDIALSGMAPWDLYRHQPGRWLILLAPVLTWYFVARLARMEDRPRPRDRAKEKRRIEPFVQSARRSERTSRAVMENVLDGIVVLTGEGVIQDVNPALERIFGYSKYELIGQDLKLLIPKHGESDSAISTLRRTVTNEIMGVEWQMDGRHKDGTVIPLELSFNALDVGDAKLFIYVMRDISARKEEEEKRRRIHEELMAARDHALAASRSKSVFLASVSHELRTPLNAILGYSEMLQEDLDLEADAELTGDLAKIHNAGRHLLQVINTILDLSKIEAGRMEVYLETFDVPRLVQGVVSTLRPMAQQNHNTLEVEIDPAVDRMTSDQTKVRQALFNLLSNALKFTRNGTVRLEVERVAEGDDARIDLRVIDTGIGMSAEQTERLFQEFTQAHADTYREYGGTGLGLAISRRFANMLQGDIEVESEPGEGSIFTLFLPERVLAPAEAPPADPLPEDPDPTADTEDDPGEEEIPTGLGTILVIDDDETARELIRRFLSRDGFRVVTAPSGQEGLRLAQELQPTAITLDVMMPQLDGWSVLSQLKTDPATAEIPVILLTMVSDRSMGYALGATDYLSKPVDRNELAAVLRRYKCAEPPCPVLVVEDEDDTRELMARMLQREGWKVEQAANGQEALDAIGRNLPELILLDLMMPEMDGFELLAALRETAAWRRIPVVVVTAMDLSEEEQRRLRGSVRGVLKKGVLSQEQLLGEVQAAVSTAAERRRRAAAPE